MATKQNVSGSTLSPHQGFGIYIHIPYCVKKCPYCDFNSYSITNASSASPLFSPDIEKQYTDAIVREAQHYLQRFTNRTCLSVFIGGGTPSLFSESSIARMLQVVSDSCHMGAEAEITLEANPGTVQETLGLEKLRGFRDAGVNRVSFGGQSFSPRKLQLLGRIHHGNEIQSAVKNAQQAGFENINVDLMYGVRGETEEEWEQDIQSVLTLRTQHLSCYNLTIESGTEFGKKTKRGENFLTSEEMQTDFFLRTHALLTAANFTHYEISNYSLPNFECRHNLGYWTGLEYLGLGAGAHGFVRSLHDPEPPHWGVRWANIPGPTDYIHRVSEIGQARQRTEELSFEQAQLEYFHLHLRLRSGFSEGDFQHRFQQSFSPQLLQALTANCNRGFLMRHENNFTPTTQGLLFTDSIMESLLPGIS